MATDIGLPTAATPGIPAGGSVVTVAVIKLVHTAIFLVNLSAIGWLVATGLTGRRDRTVAVAATAVAIESAAFILNDGVCPLTQMTERYGAASGSVSDIFLPDAVARTIPIWTTSLVVLGLLLHLRSAVRNRPARR
jgi:hypothetical protein